MKKPVQTFILVGVTLTLLTLGTTPSHGATPQMIGARILERCQKAYDALKSYEGTSKVTTNGKINGSVQRYQTSAHIRFVRPGKIRVEGTLMSSGQFAFVSNGRSTWQAWDVDGGQWKSAQSAEMAIASFTGVSQQAATTIPAILMKTAWGNMFFGTAEAVTMEKVEGRACYKVTLNTSIGRRQVWIDRTSFLLAQSHQVYQLDKIGKQIPQMSGGATGTMETLERYVNVRQNPPLAASLFAQPRGRLSAKKENPARKTRSQR